MRYIHATIGLLIIAAMLYMIFHLDAFFPTLAEPLRSDVHYRYRLIPGLVVILALPFVSAVCLLFPKVLEQKLSPRSKLLKEPVFTTGAWYVFGYALLPISAFILFLFT